MNTATRNQCQACRFAKCLAANMRPEGKCDVLLKISIEMYMYIFSMGISTDFLCRCCNTICASTLFNRVYGTIHFRNQKFNIFAIKNYLNVEA